MSISTSRSTRRMKWPILKALGETLFVFGGFGFVYKVFTVEIHPLLGREVDNWHNIVSRWLPIENDLFACIALAASFFGFLLMRIAKEKLRLG